MEGWKVDLQYWYFSHQVAHDGGIAESTPKHYEMATTTMLEQGPCQNLGTIPLTKGKRFPLVDGL